MKEIPDEKAPERPDAAVSSRAGVVPNGENAVPLPVAAEGLRGGVFVVLALLVLGVALVVRFLFIDRYEVWLDEAYCFSVAVKPIGAIVRDLALDNGPPLYYVLLHYWMLAFGESAAALRSLSVVFSAGTVALVLFWRTPWLSRAARLMAGFVLAITPLAIYYAQEARMYSPVVFFVTAAAIFLEKGLRKGGAADWALFGLFTLLGLYTSYVAIFLVPLGYLVVAVALIFDRDKAAAKRRLAGLLAAHVGAAILFGPWVPIFLGQPRAASTQWIGRNIGPPRMVHTPAWSLSVMTVGGGYYPKYLRQLRMDPLRVDKTRRAVETGQEKRPALALLTRIPPLAALSVMALLTVHLFWTALRRGSGRFPHRAFLAWWLALPIVVPLLLCLVRPMYVVGRYELTALPAFAVISGLGLAGLGKPVRVGALILAGLLFLYSWGYMQLFPRSAPAPRRAAYIAHIAESGDVVLASAFEYAPVHYYVGAKRDELQFITFPRSTRYHSAWIDYEKWLSGQRGFERPRPILYEEAAAAVEEAIAAVEVGGRIIVVVPRSGLLKSQSGQAPWTMWMERALFAALIDVTPARIEPDMEISRPRSGITVYRKLAKWD